MKRIKDVHAYLKAKTPVEIFNEFDADNSGLIDQDEFLAMIDALPFKLPEAKALKFFAHCDKNGSENIMKCTMCRGRTKCPVCQLLTTWPLNENELELIRKGDGPINRRPGLKYIGNLIVNQPAPKLDWETPKRRKPNTSQACLVS